MVKLGVAITAAVVAVLVAEWLRHRKHTLPAYGWLALAALAGAEWLMFRGVEPVATFFTPVAWTAYLLLADAAIFAVKGNSPLRREPLELAKMAALSVPLWLIFEAYNLRLANWAYAGLPENWFLRNLGFAWSFATITPAILMTAELIESFGWFVQPAKALKLSRNAETSLLASGLLCLTVPVLLPWEMGAYLFALVWIGFALLLDPINARLRLPSVIADFEQGRRGRFFSLLLAGFVCGWLWEFWNQWAHAKWIYVFPMFQQWKIFQMPAPGYLGFPPFAVECFCMYVTASWALRKIFPYHQPSNR